MVFFKKLVLRSIARTVLAMMMSVLMVVSNPLQAFAEGATGGKYLSEVYVSVASTAGEAAKKLEENGYAVLKTQGIPADLNQGANTVMKETRAVVLGYKTTADRDKAITDLAVMNMDGGYSFSSYAELMGKYRDSTIRPFIDRFMTTVGEYRANAVSQNPGNRAKAEFARSFLNRIVDDDTGGRLGDLLLQQTKAEMGDDYKSLSQEDKKKHIDLERALMQGNADVVFFVERILSYAADTSDTTWLQRLSALGSGGLEAQYANKRPLDLQKELATKYQNSASVLAENWDAVRNELLAYEKSISGDSGADADAADGEADQSQTEQGSKDDQPQIDVVDSSEQPNVEPGEVVLEGEDEVDVAELVRMDVPESTVEERELDISEVPDYLNQTAESLKTMNEETDDVNNTNIAALYSFLKSLPYDEGTLYDLFTLPASDVTANGCAMLYPAASCLSAGQIAAIEFLPLQTLLQIGASMGDMYANVWVEGLGLKDMVESVGDVSIYQGVNREIFSDITALTSDALRADALRREDTGVLDFLSQYKTSLLLWTGTAISAVLTAYSAYKNFQNIKAAKAIEIADAARPSQLLLRRLKRTVNKLENMQISAVSGWHPVSSGKPIEKIMVERVPGAVKNRAFKVTYKISFPYNESERIELLNMWKDNGFNIGNGKDGNLKIDDVLKKIEQQNDFEKAKSEVQYFAEDSGLQEGVFDFNGQCKRLKDKQKDISKIEKSSAKPSTSWGATIVFGILFLALAVASIYSTVQDVRAYYNVSYTPMPRYIVEVTDITTTGDDGTKTVFRNDTAYYSAALTDLKRTGKDLIAMMNYADLNGDVGKQWLGLYSAKGAGDPILAESLRVERGTNSLPDGYKAGIHMFGYDSAFNLTDSRYCYNDDEKGNYVYFKREAAVPTAASTLAGGNTALVGGLCLAAGVALGAGGMHIYNKRRGESATA